MCDDLSGFCCPNVDCSDHQKLGKNNLRVETRYGKSGDRRLFYCRTCGSRFSERKGSPLFKAQLSDEKITLLISYLGNGKGVREIARLVGVNRNTVVRYARLLGKSPAGGPAQPRPSGADQTEPSGAESKRRRGSIRD
jgi:LacI family transcriptional regulator